MNAIKMEVNHDVGGVQGNPIRHGGGPLTEKCPRCNSMNTKFCYFNNYSLTQPRHYCRTCRRYWTQGGICRNVPIGGSRNRRTARSTVVRPGPSTRLNPVNPHPARRRGRPSSAASVTVSGRAVAAMAGGRRTISTMGSGADFSDQFETGVSEYRRTMASFGAMPLLSATANSNLSLLREFSVRNNNNHVVNNVVNNNVVNVNVKNNVSLGLGFGNFHPLSDLAWQQESMMMSSDPINNMFIWELDGASGSGSANCSRGPPLMNGSNIINDRWSEDLSEETPSLPPPQSV